MLVLTRVEGERILIGHDVTIVVTRVRGGRVAVGISAPCNIPIRRGELCEPRVTASDDGASDGPPCNGRSTNLVDSSAPRPR
ncbi:MAG: carbon storage regulator [Planctomycetaceae bacterium]